MEDVVIVGHGADEVISLINRLNAKWVFNESFRERMLSSILTGIRSLEPGIEASTRLGSFKLEREGTACEAKQR
jgi:CTP:molybdopterin cytidylyltransferase MocA